MFDLSLALPTASGTGMRRRDVLDPILRNGFPYSRRLSAHNYCVNALAFSSGEGRFLASGGDDPHINLWDFHQEDVKSPFRSFVGPSGNVLSLAFSATNRFLFSGGTDKTVLKYDTTHLEALNNAKSPSHVYCDHSDSVRSITCHPVQDEIFMTAGEDGNVYRYDERSSSSRPRPSDTLQIPTEVTGVQYHPVMDHLFITSDARGNVCLRDERMAFGPSTRRTNEGVVLVYNTKLTRQHVKHLSNPESSSVVFDREGNKLAVTMLHYLPTIYAVSDPNPVAVCSGKNLPNGSPVPSTERTYSNSCTMKHGSFGHPAVNTDDLYCAGSDDFRGYIWKIPPISKLTELRTEMSADEWEAQKSSSAVAFTTGRTMRKYVPLEISTPFCRLNGHKSIVNTSVFHPHFLHVVTSGIEKDILLHSPTQASPCTSNLQPTPTQVRRLTENGDEDRHTYSRALAHSYPTNGELEDEQTTLSMFDHILREEGESDVFTVRRWSSDSSDEDEETDSDSSSYDFGARFGLVASSSFPAF
ncbi:hypothetical protein K443DRAFT_6548 [Laccaria amethystina LaAM-08-1]|uniref:WD40 repeat-like protein n=1 Tax=Laccaria amethystina LaAM-08-1 TaxID=1095629 RepID=A0A0C9Y1D4_9AGAR|nr:hypothetical protein K443DRAFT_6548 [Laccaria amethystina LaAM-08-1]